MNLRRSLDHITIFLCEDIFGSRTKQVPKACTADNRSEGNEQQPQHTKDNRTDSGARTKTADFDADNQLGESQRCEHTKKCRERKVDIVSPGKINDREESEYDGQNQPTKNHHTAD